MRQKSVVLLLSTFSMALALKIHNILRIENKTAQRYVNKEVKLVLAADRTRAIATGGAWKQINDIKVVDGWSGCSLNFCNYGKKCRSVDGRNNSSCCQEHSVEILKSVSHLLNHQQLEHWLVYGLLLGAIREQNYLPWETDVDLQLPMTAWTQLIDTGPSLWTRDDLPYYFKFFRSDIGRGCVVYKDENYPKYERDTEFHWNTIPYVDLYLCQKGWGTYPECSRKPSRKPTQKERETLKTQRGRTRRIRGFDFPSINNDTSYLSRWYGTAWTIPTPGYHGFNFIQGLNAGDPSEPYMSE